MYVLLLHYFFSYTLAQNAEEYKNVVKPALKELITEKDMEYLIVYIPSPSSFLQTIFFNAYERLRSDYKDR